MKSPVKKTMKKPVKVRLIMRSVTGRWEGKAYYQNVGLSAEVPRKELMKVFKHIAEQEGKVLTRVIFNPDDPIPEIVDIKQQPMLDRKAWTRIWNRYHTWYVNNSAEYSNGTHDVCGVDAFNAMRKIVNAELRRKP